MPSENRTILLAYLSLLISPLFFSTNVVFGRAATDIAPFLLAFLRWGSAGLILLAVSHGKWPEMAAIARSQWKLLLLLGFLGMFICGGVVYLALHSTTATNGTLIYTIPPVIIVLIERFYRARPLKWRESVGIALAIAGVVIIVARGSLAVLAALDFNSGDLLFVLAAISWALYSVILKSRVFANLGTLPLFCLVACFGALVLAPFAAIDVYTGLMNNGEGLPKTSTHWLMIAGIIFLASLVSFSTFQHGVRVLGASIAGIFLYLLPPFGITFAWIFLGERIEPFHITGIAAVLSGVILATFPAKLLKRQEKNEN